VPTKFSNLSFAPELLAPAGSLAMLRTACAFGADAVYAGQPRYSLRVRNNEFDRLETLRAAINELHAAKRKMYLVSNAIPHNTKVRTYLADMAPIIALKPDALIMADPGLIDMVRETWSDMPVHLSVQANTVNYASVRFWQKLGITRIILSRELSLDEITEIRQTCPDIELEVFVHGALCIAHSGRCLLSGYFNRRDSNQGSCTNSCRWKYRIKAGKEDSSGDIWLLEEGERQGEWMLFEEDEHGTYILNSKDLRAIEYIERLLQIGVDAFKIEGRTKSPYYVARTVQTYRRAIDDAKAGLPFNPGLLDDLEGLANRGYTSGFYQRHRGQEMQNYSRGHSESWRSRYVGDVIDWDGERKMVKVDVKNRFAVKDRLELVHPLGNQIFILEKMENGAGEAISLVPGNGHQVWIPLEKNQVGAMLARFLTP